MIRNFQISRFCALVSCVAALSIAAPTNSIAAIVVDESDYGEDFSGDYTAPTPIGSLTEGLNLISGVVISDAFDPDADMFTFTIDTGYTLDSIMISMDDDNHFFGFNSGNQLVDPNTSQGQDLLIATLVPAAPNQNLLELTTEQQSFAGQGIQSPAPAGDYSVWVQENNEGFYGYSLSIQVSAAAVPEPSAAFGLCVLATGAVLRRRKRITLR